MRLSSPPSRVRAVIAGALGLSMVGTGTFALALPAAAAEVSTIVTAGKTAKATSIEGNNPASNVTDGNAATRWSSEYRDGESVQIDLAATCVIDRVDLNWEGAFASEYTVSGSTDDKTWQTLATGTATGAGAQTLDKLADIGAIRHLKVTGDKRGSDYGISLYTVDGWGHSCAPLPGTPTPTPTPGGPGTPGPTEPVETELGTLVSRDAKASASTTENGDLAPKNATDGNPKTRWSSQAADGQWITVDLGATYLLDAVELDWETSYARGYVLETSLNGWTWFPYESVTGSDGGRDVITSDKHPRTRFVRMTSTERSSQFGVSLWHFNVYGSEREELPPQHGEGEGPGVLLSYKKTGTASSSQNDPQCVDCTPDKLFDQDLATRWAVAEKDWSDNAWVQVDLAAQAEISQIVLRWDPAFAKSYSIEVADSPTGPWTTVFKTVGGTGGKEVINIDPTAGRYVQVNMTERTVGWGGNKYGFSLYEFRVYGTGGDPIFPPAGPADPDFDNLKLVWSDEFDGAAGTAADDKKWTLDHTANPGDNNNAELQLYTADTNNVRHDGKGNLLIEAKVEDFHGAKFYSSGRLNTSHKVSAQYGRFEARVKVPEGKGLWPAFWMMGTSFLEGRPWPANGEIDIMEVLGHAPEETHGTVHGPGYSGMGGQGGAFTLPDKTNLSKDFHVWSADWNSEKITFRLDGHDVYTVTRDHVENTLNQAWVFDQEFYIILNLAVGGDWPGSPDKDTKFPAEMLVDYVRVFQSEGSGKFTALHPVTVPGTQPTDGTPGVGTPISTTPVVDGSVTPATGTSASGARALGETGAPAGPLTLIALLLVIGGVGSLFLARRELGRVRGMAG